MKLPWRAFSEGDTDWTAVEASPDGGWLGVSVQGGTGRGGKPRVTKCGQSSNPDRGLALEEVARTVGVTGYPCTLPLPRGQYQIMVVPEPPVLASEMERSLRWSLGPLVDFPIEKANVAWMRIPASPESSPDQPRQIYAIVARRSVVDEHAAMFHKAGLNLKAVDVRETAQRNLAALLERKGETLGLLVAGAHGVTTTFTSAGDLCLDRFIQQEWGDVASVASGSRQKFLDQLVQQVARSIEYIQQNWGQQVARIVVAPMPPGLDVRGYLAERLPVAVEALVLSSIFDISQTPELSSPANQSRYLIALGSALRGTRMAP